MNNLHLEYADTIAQLFDFYFNVLVLRGTIKKWN